MSEHTRDVLVVGAGPTGLTLAGALKKLGLSVMLIEANQGPTPYTKATNLMQGTQEQLAIFGVMDRMKQGSGAMENYMMYAYGSNLSPRDMHLRESPFSDVLFLGQNRIERHLVDWLAEIDQPIAYEHKLISLSQQADGVQAVISHKGEETLQRFKYVVGCDGPRSRTRVGTKCDFEPVKTGKWVRQIDATMQWKRLRTMKQMWLFYYDAGFAAVIHLPGGITKFMTFETIRQEVQTDPTLEEMQQKLREVSGDETATLRDPVWISHGELLTGVAPTLIDGRILLAGDAGNPILPNGGQGLNVGIQDAVNLSWKLADVINGYGSQALLSSYEAERRALRLNLEKAQLFVLDKTIDAPAWFRWFLRNLGNVMLNRGWSAVARTFSQLSNDYKNSPMSVEKIGKKGVGAGHRILDADVVSASADQQVSMFDEMLFPGWKCLLFDFGTQLTDPLQAHYKQHAWIRASVVTASTRTTYPQDSLYFDIDSVVHKRYGILKPTLLLIRPDNYVALRCPAEAVAEFDAYLQHWFTL